MWFADALPEEANLTINECYLEITFLFLQSLFFHQAFIDIAVIICHNSLVL